MRKRIKFLKELHPYHYICILITLIFVSLTVFFFSDCFIRIWESLRDLWTSILYYISDIFEFEWNISVTVNDYSSVEWTPIFGLPQTFDEFKVYWNSFWHLLFTKENLFAYLNVLSNVLRISSPLITLVILGVLLMYLFFKRYLSTYNTDRNKDSKALQSCKRAADYTYIPIKRFIKSFVRFVNEVGKYKSLWIFIWLLNFNFIAILIEFFAFYFYFISSFDVLNIYKQVVKLFCDLSPMIAFVPGWMWVIAGLLLFDKFRKSMALAVLRHHEAMNCGFINERPIVMMICGTMGKKKTTMLSDIALLQNKMFREDALQLMIKNELKFPEFPWCNVEHFIRCAVEQHIVYNLVTLKDIIQTWKARFEYAEAHPKAARLYRKKLRRHYGWPFRHNLLFDYDYKRYGMYYDNGLKLESIWDVIESYCKEYLIYTSDGSYIVSNFSVRTDTVCSDLGNLPLYDDDFYSRTSFDVLTNSRYSKIINYNALRLGRKTNDSDPYKDSFEFGTIAITEIGKERKNNLQLQELKRKDEEANQKNDGFNDWLKMVRHSATVDYHPFVKVISDEQRPESWGADARDLCDIVHIRESSDERLAMSFFSLEELLYSFIFKKFVSLRNRYNHIRSDNTVPMWFFRKLTAKVEGYYTRIYNQFGYCRLDVDVERGTQDGKSDRKHYYLDNKRIYSDRFSTDCFSDFFEAKARRSDIGLADYPEYNTVKASFEELQLQESYFVEDLLRRKEGLADISEEENTEKQIEENAVTEVVISDFSILCVNKQLSEKCKK